MKSHASSTRIPKLPQSNRSAKSKDQVFDRDPMDESAFKQIIRGMSLKITDQRMLILKSLHSGRAHVTVQEVFEKVAAKDSSVGFATVYRFLRKLKESGFVTEVRMGGQPARYELAPTHHHDHITCIRCGKICEFENSAIENMQEAIAKQFGFRLTSHVLELYGECTDCQRKNPVR